MYLAIIEFPVSDPDAASRILTRDTEKARAMPGNLAYRALADADDPTSLVILHRWTGRAEFDAYLASDLFAGLSRDLRPLMSGRPVSLRLAAQEDETVTG